MSFLILIQHSWNTHIDTKRSSCQAKSNKKLFRSFWSMIARHLSLERPVAVSKRPTSNTSSTWRNGFGRDGSISSFWAKHKSIQNIPMANPSAFCVFCNLQRCRHLQPHPSEVFSRFFHPSLQVLSSEPPCRPGQDIMELQQPRVSSTPQKKSTGALPEICLQVSWWTKTHFLLGISYSASVLEVLILTNLPWLKVNELIVNNNCIHSIHVFHRFWSKASTKLRGKIALGSFPELPIEAIDSVYLVDKIHAPPPTVFCCQGSLSHTSGTPTAYWSPFNSRINVKNGCHPKFPCWAPHPSHQSHQSQLPKFFTPALVLERPTWSSQQKNGPAQGPVVEPPVWMRTWEGT